MKIQMNFKDYLVFQKQLHDIGFFLKRARVAEQIFGSAKYHTERYANLSGF